MKFLKKLIKWGWILVFWLPAFFLIRLLRPVLFLRFGEVYSSRIGHIAGNLDNYVSSPARREGRQISFFTLRERVANEQLLKMFGRVPGVRLGGLSAKWFLELRKFFVSSPHFIRFNEEMWAIKGQAALTPPPIQFTAQERQRGLERLKERGVTGPLVCFNHRDNAYLKSIGGDGNHHDYRNSSIGHYRAWIDAAIADGFFVVRLGNLVEEKLVHPDPRFVDFSGEFSDDFMDIFLLNEATIMVGSNSGFSNVRRTFRKPQVIVNFAPFQPMHLWPFSAGSVFVPKTLFSKKENRLLTISEMRNLVVDIHYQGDFYGDQGIEVRENSPEEIIAAYREGLALSRGPVALVGADLERQNRFWAAFAEPDEIRIYRDGLGMRFSPDFLARHESLLR